MKERNEKSARNGVRYLHRFDKNFLPKVDAEIEIVRDYGIAAANALNGTNKIEYAQRLKHFKLALKVYLKRVSAKLYVCIRNEFKNDIRASKISTFESQTTLKLSQIGSFLNEAKNVDWKEKEALRSEFLSKISELTKIYDQEREFLHPIYLELDDSVVSFPQKRNAPIKI